MRIKENEIEDILKFFNNKNCNIKIQGIFRQEIFFEDINIIFDNNSMEFEIKDHRNAIIFNLSYIEEIYFMQKNKLKFLTNNNLEILIIFS